MQNKFIKRAKSKKVLAKEESKFQEYEKGLIEFKSQIEPTLPPELPLKERWENLLKDIEETKKKCQEFSDELKNDTEYQEYLKDKKPIKKIQPLKRME